MDLIPPAFRWTNFRLVIVMGVMLGGGMVDLKKKKNFYRMNSSNLLALLAISSVDMNVMKYYHL